MYEEIFGEGLEELLALRIDRDRLVERIAGEMIRYYELMSKALVVGGDDLLVRAREKWDIVYQHFALFEDGEYGIDYLALIVANNYVEKHFGNVYNMVGYDGDKE